MILVGPAAASARGVAGGYQSQAHPGDGPGSASAAAGWRVMRARLTALTSTCATIAAPSVPRHRTRPPKSAPASAAKTVHSRKLRPGPPWRRRANTIVGQAAANRSPLGRRRGKKRAPPRRTPRARPGGECLGSESGRRANRRGDPRSPERGGRNEDPVPRVQAEPHPRRCRAGDQSHADFRSTKR